MKSKKVFVYLFFVVSFSTMLFFLFYNNTLKMNSSLGAAVTPVSNDDIVLITAAKEMISEKYNDYNGNLTLTVKDLVKDNYLTGEEINPVSNELYSENIRIVSRVVNGAVQDIYVKNEPFKNAFVCKETCYINKNNYIAFNNDLYRIIKVDTEGNIYITNNEVRYVNLKDAENKLNTIYNNLDKSLVSAVTTASLNDIKESSIINNEEDLIVLASTGYKILDSVTENTISTNKKANLLIVVVLNNEVTYEMGDGTKFNPYIITE